MSPGLATVLSLITCISCAFETTAAIDIPLEGECSLDLDKDAGGFMFLVRTDISKGPVLSNCLREFALGWVPKSLPEIINIILSCLSK